MISKGMMKLIFAGVVAVGGFIAYQLRVAGQRKQMEALRSGKVCLHCDSGDVEPEEGGIRCRACGQFTPASFLAFDARDAEELASMAAPPDKRR
ncbi:MAG: hypothetical protein AAGH15_14420 [Myxococcota bacterium]